MNRIFILSAVPLATALSHSPGRPEPKIQPAAEILREADAAEQSKSGLHMPDGYDRGPLSAELQHRGIDAAAADRIIEQASLAGRLDPSGYQWQKGQRLTGVLLVPDSAAVICQSAHLVLSHPNARTKRESGLQRTHPSQLQSFLALDFHALDSRRSLIPATLYTRKKIIPSSAKNLKLNFLMFILRD